MAHATWCLSGAPGLPRVTYTGAAGTHRDCRVSVCSELRCLPALPACRWVWTLCSTRAAAPSQSTSGSSLATCRVRRAGLRFKAGGRRAASPTLAQHVPWLKNFLAWPRIALPACLHPAPVAAGDSLSYLFSHRGTSRNSSAAANTGWGPNQIQASQLQQQLLLLLLLPCSRCCLPLFLHRC